MIFDVVTLFPGMFLGALADGVVARARRRGTVAVRLHDLRRWGVGGHRVVDDQPYGGGAGMVMKPEPFFEAVDWIRERYPVANSRVVLLSPQGMPLSDAHARRLGGYERLVLLSGRYEGIDERVREGLADEEISVGDMVLTGGEIPALAVIDAVSRFIPGVLGSAESAEQDSFARIGLDFPHYTRPAVYRGRGVPAVLTTGDHGAIERWRAAMARRATETKRPDLVQDRARSEKSAEARRG